ncbi:MAG: WD40 repeat domain-containing protein, partial [Elainellaceae cyanobacterium]
RQRTRQLANTQDVDQKIQASLKRGGWFTPVYGYRQVIPEYLVLIDRASYADHLAKLVETLVQQLRQEGVYATRYYFDSDARVCYPDVQAGLPQALETLARQHREKRLVVVASAETFYSSQTGEAVLWLEELQGWEQRAILVPNSAETWGRWEFGLASQFIVLPLTPQGIVTLAMVFRHGSATYSLTSDAAPFPETLAMRPQRWLERHAPKPEEGRQMLAELSTYLGETGLYWFAACAVFPELHWSITVYLGNVLQDGNGQPLLKSDPLTKLARLPWFRQGYIPDWLRQYLVVNLSSKLNKAIHQAFQQLMVTAVQGAVGPLQLQIAQQYQKSLSNLTNPLLRLLSWRAEEAAPLKDYIFVDFMARVSLLTVAVPEDVQPLLRGSRYEQAVRQQRRTVAGVVSGLVVVAGLNVWWVATAVNRQMARTLRSAEGLVAENQSLKALVDLTQVGQMLRAAGSKNPRLNSSAMSLFLQLTPRRVDVSESSFEFREQNQLEGHSNAVYSVAFSPDGQTIASGSLDRTIKLWDRSGNELATLQGHSAQVYSVAFSPDGQTIASGSFDRTIRLQAWSLDTFVALSCDWLGDYLRTNPTVTDEDRALCGIVDEDSSGGRVPD